MKQAVLFIAILTFACAAEEGDTGIHFLQAVASGELQKVKTMLAANPKLINAKADSDGSMGLHIAKDKATAELLLLKGADIKAKDKFGGPPLHYACRGGDKQMVDFLVSKGADINAEDYEGSSAMHWARTKELVEFLLSKGADVNAKGKFRHTPLHKNADRGNVEVVELLIKRGADINARDARGETPLDWTKITKDEKVIDLLTKHGAKYSRDLPETKSVEKPAAEKIPPPKPTEAVDVIVLKVTDQAKALEVFKALRVIGLNIKEAQQVLDKAPQPVKKGIAKTEAVLIKEKLEKAGATVEMKPTAP
jgi:ribosomal protein L7/L12